MKKKTITIGALLLAMNSFSQIDTLANSINGKNKYEFNYYTNEIKNVVKPKKYQDFIFTIKKNNYLYVDLFDDMELFYEELEALRVSGVMNMYGAPKWLEENYDLSRKEAVYVFLAWCDFKEEEQEKLLTC